MQAVFRRNRVLVCFIRQKCGGAQPASAGTCGIARPAETRRRGPNRAGTHLGSLGLLRAGASQDGPPVTPTRAGGISIAGGCGSPAAPGKSGKRTAPGKKAADQGHAPACLGPVGFRPHDLGPARVGRGVPSGLRQAPNAPGPRARGERWERGVAPSPERKTPSCGGAGPAGGTPRKARSRGGLRTGRRRCPRSSSPPRCRCAGS